MREVFVYVEGPGDQLSMRALLDGVIKLANQQGDKLDFYPLNGKEPLLIKGPKKAINILRNRSKSYVFILPDLYPPNKPFKHSTFKELEDELKKRFKIELQSKKCDERIMDRFFVHCFKYDLEVLILASEDALLKRLEKRKFSRSWANPVEDQDHNRPPKRVVEELFHDARMKYKGTSDAPWILSRSNYEQLMKKCYQNFKPFIEDLLRILGMDTR